MNKRTGFTLVELLVVIGIIGMLIAIAQPILTGSASRTYEYQCESHLRHIGTAMTAYSQDNGAFPSRLRQVDDILQDKSVLDSPRLRMSIITASPHPARTVTHCSRPA